MYDVSHPRHITGGLEHSISLLEVQPRYKTQQDNFDLVLQCWLNLLYLLLSLGLSYQVGGRGGRGGDCQQSSVLSVKQTFLRFPRIAHPSVLSKRTK